MGYKGIKVNGKKIDAHRHIWEQANGPIPKGCVIHHIDGDRHNNDLSNLQMMTYEDHNRLHFSKPIVHGIANGYRKGCRCDECLAYKQAEHQRRKDRKRRNANDCIAKEAI